MTQPTREHRHDRIHPRLCLSYGVVSGLLWRQHLDTRQPVDHPLNCRCKECRS